MKKILSKNSIIILLLALNMGLSAYTFKDKISLTPEPLKIKREAIVEPAAVFKNDNELQKCYESYLSTGQSVDEGSVTFYMVFSTDGKIDSLELADTDFEDENFTDCLIQKIQSKKYSVSKERIGVLFAQKLNFHKKALSTMNFDR